MYKIENKRYKILAYYPTHAEAAYWLNKYKEYGWIQSNATIKSIH